MLSLRHRTLTLAKSSLYLCLALLLSPGSLSAAAAPSIAATSIPVAIVAADTIVSLLTPRPEEEIQADILAAQKVTLAAGQDRALAELARADAEVKVQITKEQIESLEREKKRIEDLRAGTQDEEAKAEYETQRRELEREKELQDRRKRLFETDEDLAGAKQELARALERQMQADTELYRRELQLALANESAIPQVERTVLEAWKTATERAQDVVGKRKRVIELQIEVLDRAKDLRERS